MPWLITSHHTFNSFTLSKTQSCFDNQPCFFIAACYLIATSTLSQLSCPTISQAFASLPQALRFSSSKPTPSLAIPTSLSNKFSIILRIPTHRSTVMPLPKTLKLSRRLGHPPTPWNPFGSVPFPANALPLLAVFLLQMAPLSWFFVMSSRPHQRAVEMAFPFTIGVQIFLMAFQPFEMASLPFEMAQMAFAPSIKWPNFFNLYI